MTAARERGAVARARRSEAQKQSMADSGAEGGACLVELVVFKQPAYVYAVPPARSAAGHRCAVGSRYGLKA